MKISKTLAEVALHVTKTNVNSACLFWTYQPEIPKMAKKLKK